MKRLALALALMLAAIPALGQTLTYAGTATLLPSGASCFVTFYQYTGSGVTAYFAAYQGASVVLSQPPAPTPTPTPTPRPRPTATPTPRPSGTPTLTVVWGACGQNCDGALVVTWTGGSAIVTENLSTNSWQIPAGATVTLALGNTNADHFNPDTSCTGLNATFDQQGCTFTMPATSVTTGFASDY